MREAKLTQPPNETHLLSAPLLSAILDLAPGQSDPRILGLTADSRRVQPGWLFAALPGVKVDGASFIPAALAQGAVAVLAAHGTDPIDGVPVITRANPRQALAQAAARFYGAQPEIMTAVTGTNGKTSTAAFYRQIWQRLGQASAAIGTLGVTAPGWDSKGGLTTPDTVALHEILARLAAEGVTRACMEASSHGLDQYRLDGVRLQAAGFTNLTRDHLDYHPTMAAYGEAKLRLFRELLPEGAAAVVNADSDFAPQVIAAAQARKLRLLTYGVQGHDIRLQASRPVPGGQILTLDLLGDFQEVFLPLAGGFQVANALCALGLALATGAEPAQALVALSQLEGVPGRLQAVATRSNGAAIFVDYAHTPDALETILTALRPHAARELVVVFGCGGDRDPGKRPQMGLIASRLADRVIVTDDNPRSELPSAIRDQILSAAPLALEIGDRAQAIRTAIQGLQAGDVLVIAGKGHETGQIIGAETHPFDDAQEARDVVANLAPAPIAPAQAQGGPS